MTSNHLLLVFIHCPMLPTPSQQPKKITLLIPILHGKGMSNVVAHPSPLQGTPSHSIGGRSTNFHLKVTLAQHIAQRAPTTPHMGIRLVGATIGMHVLSPTRAQLSFNISLTNFGCITRRQKKKKTKKKPNGWHYGCNMF